jgi:hypothetical protein
MIRGHCWNAMSLDSTSQGRVPAQMAAMSVHVPSQHISPITATNGASVFAGSNTTINIGERAIHLTSIVLPALN